ncbi:MAG TPA: LCP family protein [Candidatus Acidoferrales bacterium]|nr:LCP family protein [Candidatus Acidoferrales bacterium]
MFRNPWIRLAVVAFAATASVVAGFLLLREPISQHVAMQAAEGSFGVDKLNVLLLGYQDDEATTDTVLLAHLDVDRRTATLVSIPRDSWVPVPGHGYQKINAAYAYGGTKMSAAVVSTLMGGIPIDATIALQPEGAAQIVDALGGLNVDVDENMDYDDDNGDLHIHLKKGEQYLTGSQVVGYIRFRHDASSDYGRMHRQQQVIRLLLNQLSQPQNWTKLPRLLQFARKDVETTLSDKQLVALLEIYRNVPEENVRSFTLPSRPGWVGDASVVFVDPRWSKLIGRVLFSKSDPPQDEVLLANATGDAEFDKTIVAALRGGGWNVPTFVDQPAKKDSVTIGTTLAARALSKTFATELRPGTKTTLLIGSDLAPDTE